MRGQLSVHTTTNNANHGASLARQLCADEFAYNASIEEFARGVRRAVEFARWRKSWGRRSPNRDATMPDAQDTPKHPSIAWFDAFVKRLETIGRLTPRQAEVLKLRLSGATVRDVATTLRISPETAAKHSKHALQRLGADGLSDIVRIYADSLGSTSLVSRRNTCGSSGNARDV